MRAGFCPTTVFRGAGLPALLPQIPYAPAEKYPVHSEPTACSRGALWAGLDMRILQSRDREGAVAPFETFDQLILARCLTPPSAITEAHVRLHKGGREMRVGLAASLLVSSVCSALAQSADPPPAFEVASVKARSEERRVGKECRS